MARRTATVKPWAPWAQRLNEIFPIRNGTPPIEPLSEEWRQARRGRLTASSRAILIAERNPAMWNRMMHEIDHELSPGYQWVEANAPALAWGRDHEKEAIANIMLNEADELTEPGLIFHPKYPFVAATPDGLIDGKISVQIKCPYNSKNHLETLYNKTIRPVYRYQTLWEAWCTGAKQIRFYSYDPRQPMKTQLVRLDIPVEQKVLDTFEKNAVEFAELFSQGKRLAEGRLSAMGIPDF